MFLLLLALQVTSPARADSVSQGDSIPLITLADAIQRSTRLDPAYVRAFATFEMAVRARRMVYAW